MARIELQQVSKTFGDNGIAVRDVNLQIAEGEFFVLVGPSGCGKSTLLNLIVGLEPVSAGTVRVDGKVVNELDPKDRNMAMVFQHYALYPHMSVRENLAFPLTLAKQPRAEIDRRVREAAELLELTALLERRPSTLSGGQRQRVAMGRAMVRQPAAFLMDEPLSNLDAKLRVQMRHEIAQLQRRLQVTTIYVTHDQTEAMTLADRVAVLYQGEVQQVGTPQQLYERPANRFVAEFIGSPTMNLLPAVVRDDSVRLPMVEVPSAWSPSLPRPGRVLAGVRPEHFTSTAPDAEAVSFQVQLSWIDWLGADAYGWFPLPETAADLPRHGVARLDAEAGLKPGDTVTLFLQSRHVHWFDADSGARL